MIKHGAGQEAGAFSVASSYCIRNDTTTTQQNDTTTTQYNNNATYNTLTQDRTGAAQHCVTQHDARHGQHNAIHAARDLVQGDGAWRSVAWGGKARRT